MARIGTSLQRIEKSLRKTVAPGVGDDIIEVWRGKVAVGAAPGAAPGGALLNEMGRTVRTNVALPGATGGAGIAKVAAYYGRFGPRRGGGMEGNFGTNVSVTGFAFTFNAGDHPQIESDDRLIVAVKRSPKQKIEELGWQANTVYEAGQREQPSASNGRVYLRTSGTTSGAAEPVWPTVKGATVVDGDGAWQCEGLLPFYGVVDPSGEGTISVNYAVTAERK